MTFQQNPSTRQPKGDHNRRLALGMDIEVFAAEAGLTQDQAHEYEMTSPDHSFDEDVAQRYGAALERMEANPPSTQIVQNSTVIQPNSASTDLPESPDPQAPAFKDGELPKAADQPAPVRSAGPEGMRDGPPGWDETDQASDESFPASDPPANNKFD